MCIIEIYGEPEGSPGPEFEEVTLDEPQARGYLTCAEQWQITPPDSVSQYTNESGFEAASWATPIPDRTKKRVWAGSKTIRPYSGPWYVHCFYRQYYDGEIHIIHDAPLFSHHGDGEAIQYRLGYSRSRSKIHLVDGKHAFEVPPEVFIKTQARLEY